MDHRLQKVYAHHSSNSARSSEHAATHAGTVIVFHIEKAVHGDKKWRLRKKCAFLPLPLKRKTIVFALLLALPTSSYHSAAVFKFG